MPSSPLKDGAFHALGSAYSLSYLIAGTAVTANVPLVPCTF
jgi:hypothetical protein